MGRPEVIKTPLGERLRAIRAALGDPDRENFCLRLGISRGSLANYERGDRVPDATVLSAYREACGANLNWLLSAEGEMFAPSGNTHEQSQPIIGVNDDGSAPDTTQGGIAPGWTPEIGERIEKAVQRAGGYPRAAKIADTKAEQIRKWRNGSARPPLFGMAAIAGAAGVSVDWLISGSQTGAMQQQSQTHTLAAPITEVVPPDYSVASQEHLDQEILPRVVDAVARAYRTEGISISVMDLVRIGSDYLRDVVQAFTKAHAPLTIDAVIPVAWLLTAWVQRDLRKPKAVQEQTKREASGS